MKAKLLHLAAILAALFVRPRPVVLANIAESEHDASQGISYKSDVVITERFLLAKRGASSDSIDICGAANVPIGVITDEAAAINDYVDVAQFNSSTAASL